MKIIWSDFQKEQNIQICYYDLFVLQNNDKKESMREIELKRGSYRRVDRDNRLKERKRKYTQRSPGFCITEL